MLNSVFSLLAQLQRAWLRWLALVALAFVALQLFFLARIVLIVWVNPASTAFERSQMWQRWQSADSHAAAPWHQHWVDYEHISDAAKRAVLTAEDDTFTTHHGVRWQAMLAAWKRNQKAIERAQRQAAAKTGTPADEEAAFVMPALHGGSTITQQLAKNLLLSGQRSFIRKGQELVLALTLEAVLDKRRILELYLNHAEWGAGIWGIEAAARHYFGVPAAQLNREQAARLAVLLPRPRHWGTRIQSAPVQRRAHSIASRMAATPIP